MPHSTQILVLGAGLAGLRAAWAAAETAPGARVTLAALSDSPSGSSFANRNGQLGMILPLGDAERTQLRKEALALAAPGRAVPELVDLLFREAEARFLDLERLGLLFQRNADGSPARRPACFSSLRCAAVLDDLPLAFGLLTDRLRALGVELRTGLEAESLLVEGGGVRGALFRGAEGERTEIRAGAVIAALGGPAPLHGRHIAGPGNPGRGWELLRRAGARMENTEYLQYLWMTLPEMRFLSPADAAGPDAVALAPDGREVAPSAKVLALADARRAHCPAAWGPVPFAGRLEHDYGMDQWLQSLADAEGVVRIKIGQRGCERIALFAQAGNGGALIDADAAVIAERDGAPLPGLFACGECATGMHGANRLGGAMVAATQVFGRRAGEAAARYALSVARG